MPNFTMKKILVVGCVILFTIFAFTLYEKSLKKSSNVQISHEKSMSDFDMTIREARWAARSLLAFIVVKHYEEEHEEQLHKVNKSIALYESMISTTIVAQRFKSSYNAIYNKIDVLKKMLMEENAPPSFSDDLPEGYLSQQIIDEYEKLFKLSDDFWSENAPHVPPHIELEFN